MMQLTFLQAEKCGERLLIGKRQRENETGIEFIIPIDVHQYYQTNYN